MTLGFRVTRPRAMCDQQVTMTLNGKVSKMSLSPALQLPAGSGSMEARKATALLWSHPEQAALPDIRSPGANQVPPERFSDSRRSCAACCRAATGLQAGGSPLHRLHPQNQWTGRSPNRLGLQSFASRRVQSMMTQEPARASPSAPKPKTTPGRKTRHAEQRMAAGCILNGTRESKMEFPGWTTSSQRHVGFLPRPAA